MVIKILSFTKTKLMKNIGNFIQKIFERFMHGVKIILSTVCVIVGFLTFGFSLTFFQDHQYLIPLPLILFLTSIFWHHKSTLGTRDTLVIVFLLLTFAAFLANPVIIFISFLIIFPAIFMLEPKIRKVKIWTRKKLEQVKQNLFLVVT